MISFDSLLVDGCHPYSEDLWKTVKINNLTFMGVRMRDCCKVKILNIAAIFSPGIFSIPIRPICNTLDL